MRRSLSVLPRVLIALWGLWFTALVTEVPGLDTCPVHAHHAHGGHAMAMGMAMGGPHEHVHGARAADAPRSVSATHTAQCTCMGCCAGSASLPSVIVLRAADAIVADAPAACSAQLVLRAAWPHALPFATAPPATV